MLPLTKNRQRLTKLDLHDNQLVQVANLHQLPVLETCILSEYTEAHLRVSYS